MTRRAAIAALAVAFAAFSQARGEWVTEVVTQEVSAASYVTNGLVAMWDGIENAGWGTHSETATVWENLVSANNITLTNSAYFSNSALVTDSSYRRSGVIDTLIPWQNIVHAEYQLNILGAPGTYRDKICSLATTYRIGIYDMCSRVLAWNNNNDLCGLMVKCDSYWDTGIAKIPNGEMSLSIDYGTGNPDISPIPALYSKGVLQTITWKMDGVIGGDGFIGGGESGDSVYCEIRSIRYYSRTLTAAEVAWNYRIDKWRYVDGHGNTPMPLTTNRVYRAPAPMRSFDAQHPFNAPTARTRLGGTGNGEDGTTLRPTAHIAIKRNEED